MPDAMIRSFGEKAVRARGVLARGLLAVGALSAGACIDHSGPEQVDPAAFAWNAPVNAGQTVYVRNTNGSIEVRPATDGNVKVTAEVKWRRGDPKKDLKFETANSANGPTICAIWGTGSCDASGYNSRQKFGSSHTDANVSFVVYAPTGVKVDVWTLNGPVTVTATAPVRARTMNGEIKVATSVGPVDAETVNGSVDVRMTTLGPDGPVRAHTVNGSASAYVPEMFDGRVSLKAVLGDVTSDFTGSDMAKTTKHFTATIGTGARLVDVAAVTGSASVRKLNASGNVVAP